MSKIVITTSLIILAVSIYLLSQKPDMTTPQSSQNQTKYQFDRLVQDKNLDISNLDIDPYNHKISFTLLEDNHTTQVVLSDQKDLWLQLNALQKIGKMVKIENRSATLVDLSLKHPYATIQNN